MHFGGERFNAGFSEVVSARSRNTTRLLECAVWWKSLLASQILPANLLVHELGAGQAYSRHGQGGQIPRYDLSYRIKSSFCESVKRIRPKLFDTVKRA